AGSEDCGERRGGDALPQRGDDATRYKHELGHGRQVQEIPILPEPPAAHKSGAYYVARPRVSRATVRSRPMSARTASMAGVLAVPATSTRSGIITCGALSWWLAAAALIAAARLSRCHGTVASSRCRVKSASRLR